MADYSKYATMDDWLAHVQSNPKFQAADDRMRQQVLGEATKRYTQWHASLQKPKEGSVEGEHLQPSAMPTAKTVDKPPTQTPAPEQPQQPDITARAKAGLQKAEEGLPSGPTMGGHLGGMIRGATNLLPEDNAQSFIDAFTLGTLAIPGYGEWEGLGWATKLAFRTAATGAAGAAGGAIQGGESGAIRGGIKGGAEQFGGEAAEYGGRKIFRAVSGAFVDRTAQARKYSLQDVQRVGDWLSQRFKDFPGMKTMKDWGEAFNQGGLKKVAQKDMDAADKKVAAEIENYAKPKPAPKPTSQKTAFAKSEDIPTQRRTLNEQIDALEKKIKDQGGQVDPQTQEQLRQYRQKRQNLGLSNQPQKPTITINKPGASPQLKDPTKIGGPTVQLKGVPLSIAKKFDIPRGPIWEASMQDAIDVMHDIEDIGWNMSKGTPQETSIGVAARSSAIQIEHDIASRMDEVFKPGVATDWYTARLRQREANVLHNLLGAKGVIDEVTGNLNSHVVMSEAASQQLYMDLEGAVGPEEAKNFVSMVGREPGPITATDQPGKTFSASVSIHPSLETGLYPRVWLHPGHAPIRIAGQTLPYDLGPGRALTAAMVLGPDRFVHMLGQMLQMAPLPQAGMGQQQAQAQ